MQFDWNVLFVILTVSLVTIALRAAPLLAMHTLSTSPFLRYIGQKMPVGIMILLVAYTFKDTPIGTFPYGLPLIVSLLVTTLIYWLSTSPILAIGSGLACHLLIVNVYLG